MNEQTSDYIFRCHMAVKMDDGPELDAELEALDSMWNAFTEDERAAIDEAGKPA